MFWLGNLWYCNSPLRRAYFVVSVDCRGGPLIGFAGVLLFVVAIFAGMTWLMD
jgi:hypothetical protein